MLYNQQSLPVAEEVSLGNRIQAGLHAAGTLAEPLEADERSAYERLRDDGLAARDALILGNLRLAESRVRRAKGNDRDPEEMRSTAFEALCVAAGRFDPAHGTKFSTYAVLHIDRAIQNGLDTNVAVREPIKAVVHARRAHNRAMALNLEAVLPAPRPVVVVASIDGSAMEIPSTEPCHSERGADRSEVAMLLGLMTERQAEVIRLVYGLLPDDERPKSLSETARILGVTVQTVHGIHKAALARARKGLALAA
jgi:RNA polymerase sigma factor (sigma-70 family)